MSGKAGSVVEIYTDGACSGNPGPGGWGAVLDYRGTTRELWGARRKPPTTAWNSWQRSGRLRL